MRVKDIVDENFQDYKKTSMFIATCFCTWKCALEAGKDPSMCQNCKVALQENIEVPDTEIVSRYMSNPITSAIVIGGLEPFDQKEELFNLIKEFRKQTDDDIVIYSGYKEEEVQSEVNVLTRFRNIIVKFGRFIPDSESRFDEVLGVTLASPNQYAKRIS